jgi:hypothetical protein
MTTLTASTDAMIQGVGAQGTPQAPERPSMPTAEQRQAMQDAARQMRDAIRANVNEQMINAQASAAAAKALRDQGVTIVGAPNIQGVNQDGPITIQTRDGKTIVSRGTAAPTTGGPPPEVVDISIAFFVTVAAIVILLPLARAFARRMDRRSAGTQVPPEVTAQLEHLNRAVDAIALEVERISEGQRFTTRLLTDQRESIPGLPTGANR